MNIITKMKIIKKTIKRNSIEKLEIEVKNRGLEWIKLN